MTQFNRVDDVMEKLRFGISIRFKQLGITDEQEMLAYIARHANVRAGKRPTVSDLVSLLHVMDRQLALTSNHLGAR